MRADVAMPSIITLLALPPGVQQTANDVLSEERGRQRVRQKSYTGELVIGCYQHCDNLVAHVVQKDWV